MNIKEIASELAIGEVHRDVCPFCKANHERSFVIYRRENGAAYYKCHRASCQERGRVQMGKDDFNPIHKPKPIKDRKYRGEIIHEPLEQPEFKFYSPSEKAYMWKLLDPWGEQWGWEARYNKSESAIKCKRFIEKEYPPQLHWPLSAVEGEVAILTEDWLSAEKVNDYLANAEHPVECIIDRVRVVALLGTELNEVKAKELRREGIREIWVWLDSGTASAVSKIQKAWDGVFRIRVVRVGDGVPDPKHLTKSSIREVVEGISRHDEGVRIEVSEEDSGYKITEI